MSSRFRRRSPVGSFSARHARTFTVPVDALTTLTSVLDTAFSHGHFRHDSVVPADGVLRAYGRGSALSDAVLGGTGLSAFTTRIGPLSLRGRVLLCVEKPIGGSVRVVISQVTGDAISADIVTIVNDALQTLAARGVPIADDGWCRSLDLPSASPGHPHTARGRGLA